MFFKIFFSSNNYCQKHKEKLQKEARERYQNPSEKEKEKGKKWLETDIKIFLKKKKKNYMNHHDITNREKTVM